ncbi:MAG: hypothetical protein DCC68_22540, partial [Planctomycetota bacterium]
MAVSSMPRRSRRYTAHSLNTRCPPAWVQKTRDEILPALTTHALATAFISDFVAVMNNPRLALPNAYVGLIEEWFTGYLGAADMLYHLDRLLKASKATIGYTDRLSEAGGDWGEAGPTTLTDADPLGLVATLEALSCNVAIIDPQAVDDGDATSRDGPVIVTYQSGSNNTCTLLDGTTAKTYNDGDGASA